MSQSSQFFLVHDSQGGSQRFPVSSGRMIVGSAENCDIQLMTDDIAPHHTELIQDSVGRWWVRDLGSSGGTWLNGWPVAEELIQLGDQCELGDFLIELVEMSEMDMSEQVYSKSEDLDVFEPEQAPQVEVSHITSIAEFGHRLHNEASSSKRLRMLCRAMVRRDFHGLCAHVLRVVKKTKNQHTSIEKPKLVCSENSVGRDKQRLHISSQVVRAVVTQGGPVLASNGNQADFGNEVLRLPDAEQSVAVVACPLRESELAVSMLYVVFPAEYGTTEWFTLVSLVVKAYEQAESTWSSRKHAEQSAALEQQLASARHIQSMLLPDVAKLNGESDQPNLNQTLRSHHVSHESTAVDLSREGLEIAMEFEPCDWVAGDYVDVIPLSDGRVFFTVADVSDRGLMATLTALRVHSVVHAQLKGEIEPEPFFRILNEHLMQFTMPGSFVTMAGMWLDPQTGDFECINCGHQSPIIVGKPSANHAPADVIKHPVTQGWRLKEGVNFPLGLMSQEIHVQRGCLQPGQLICMVTDGLTQLPDSSGRPIGAGAVAAHLATLFDDGCTASDFVDRVNRAFDEMESDEWAGDDRTFLAIRRKPAAEEKKDTIPPLINDAA